MGSSSSSTRENTVSPTRSFPATNGSTPSTSMEFVPRIEESSTSSRVLEHANASEGDPENNHSSEDRPRNSLSDSFVQSLSTPQLRGNFPSVASTDSISAKSSVKRSCYRLGRSSLSRGKSFFGRILFDGIVNHNTPIRCIPNRVVFHMSNSKFLLMEIPVKRNTKCSHSTFLWITVEGVVQSIICVDGDVDLSSEISDAPDIAEDIRQIRTYAARITATKGDQVFECVTELQAFVFSNNEVSLLLPKIVLSKEKRSQLREFRLDLAGNSSTNSPRIHSNQVLPESFPRNSLDDLNGESENKLSGEGTRSLSRRESVNGTHLPTSKGEAWNFDQFDPTRDSNRVFEPASRISSTQANLRVEIDEICLEGHLRWLEEIYMLEGNISLMVSLNNSSSQLRQLDSSSFTIMRTRKSFWRLQSFYTLTNGETYGIAIEIPSFLGSDRWTASDGLSVTLNYSVMKPRNITDPVKVRTYFGREDLRCVIEPSEDFHHFVVGITGLLENSVEKRDVLKIYALISAKAIFYGEEHVLEKTDAESVPLIHYSDRAVEFSHAVERHELPLKLPFDRHIRQDSSNSSDALAFTESLPELPMCTRQRSSSADDERFPESVLERGSTSCVDATQAMREESNDDPVRSLFPRSQDGHSVASRRKLGVDMGSCTPEGIHSPFESSFRTGSDLSLLDNVDHSAPVLEWVGSEHQTAGSEKSVVKPTLPPVGGRAVHQIPISMTELPSSLPMNSDILPMIHEGV